MNPRPVVLVKSLNRTLAILVDPHYAHRFGIVHVYTYIPGYRNYIPYKAWYMGASEGTAAVWYGIRIYG